ncbi:hypothetical protein ACLKA7_011831 [Drosophila subpalustris]
MDETWIHHHIPESNRSSAEWREAGEAGKGKTSQSKPGQYTFGVHEESPGYSPQLHKREPGGCVSSLGRLGRPAKFRGPKSCQTVATLLADSC